MSDAEENFVAWLRGQGMHDSAGLVERLTAERDALRDLLREAYEWRDTLWPVSTTVRIAAALNKGDGDE